MVIGYANDMGCCIAYVFRLGLMNIHGNNNNNTVMSHAKYVSKFEGIIHNPKFYKYFLNFH